MGVVNPKVGVASENFGALRAHYTKRTPLSNILHPPLLGGAL
jgi:hypothetical protein